MFSHNKDFYCEPLQALKNPTIDGLLEILGSYPTKFNRLTELLKQAGGLVKDQYGF